MDEILCRLETMVVETIVSWHFIWYLRGSHHCRLSWVLQDFVHPPYVYLGLTAPAISWKHWLRSAERQLEAQLYVDLGVPLSRAVQLLLSDEPVRTSRLPT